MKARNSPLVKLDCSYSKKKSFQLTNTKFWVWADTDPNSPVTDHIHALVFYPIWAYWACFTPGITAKYPFLLLSQRTVRDAPPWRTWLRTLHRWRKVGISRRRKKPSTQRDLNPRPPDYEECTLPLCYSCSPIHILVIGTSQREL